MARIEDGLESMQGQPVEREIDDRDQRLVHQPATPVRAPEDVADFRAPVAPVK